MFHEININILMLLIVLFASFIHGSIGFGFPIVATPMLATIMDLKSAIFITIIPTIIINILSIINQKEWMKIAKKHIVFSFIALLGSIIGTILLIWFDAAWFKLILAFMILLYLAINFFKLDIINIKNISKFTTRLFAFVGGVLGGLTNVMSPILIIYSLINRYPKDESTTFLNLSFLLGKISQLSIFIIMGIFIDYKILIFTITTSLFGFYIGQFIKGIINENFYKMLVKIILFITAISIISKYIY